jgi:gas vesicle protein
MSNRNESRDTLLVLAGAVVGGAVGAGLGILFAPQSGEETRKQIKDKATDIKDKVEDEYVPKIKEEVNKRVAEAVDSVNKVTDDLQEELAELKAEKTKSSKKKS